ncbi:unnamed protein product, partial [Effrenium voratum]
EAPTTTPKPQIDLPHTTLVKQCGTLQTECPASWSTAPSGGYYCHTNGGCQEAKAGPFPVEDCQEQCSIGNVHIPGGGDVAVPFNCMLQLQSWRTYWSETKKQWCCQHTAEGRVACGAEESHSSNGSLKRCSHDVENECPAEWYQPHSGQGGFNCQVGGDKGGCRPADQGPFPLETCKEQCYIGAVTIGG